jgi:hypothetical protein
MSLLFGLSLLSAVGGFFVSAAPAGAVVADSCPASILPTAALASSTTAGSPATNIYDGKLNTAWSSQVDASAASSESIVFAWSGAQNLSDVNVYPSWVNGYGAAGFPTAFIVYWWNGTQWIYGNGFNSFPSPSKGWVDLPLTQMVSTTDIMITASTLATDSNGHYDFQLAEASASCSSISGATADDESSDQGTNAQSFAQPTLKLSSAAIMARAYAWLGVKPPYFLTHYFATPTDFYGDGKGDAPSPTTGTAWREDCSGFVSYAWDVANSGGGFDTYHVISGGYATPEAWSALQPGDALVFDGTIPGAKKPTHHMGLYAGPDPNGGFYIIDETEPGRGTQLDHGSSSDGFWQYFQPIRFVGFTSSGPSSTNGAVQIVANPNGPGYWLLSAAGGVYAFGGAPFFGSAAGASYFSGQTAVAMAADASGEGYWILSASGGIYAYGDAPYSGGALGQSYFAGLTAKSLVAGPSAGYLILSNKGGIYGYGGAPNYGGAAGQSYFAGLTATNVEYDASGHGYWILSNKGGIYAYGDAANYGGAAGQSYFAGLTAVSMAMDASGHGYWILSNMGGIYAYGDAANHAGAAGQSYFAGQTASSMAMDGSGGGYWISSTAYPGGDVYAYGDAHYWGGHT